MTDKICFLFWSCCTVTFKTYPPCFPLNINFNFFYHLCTCQDSSGSVTSRSLGLPRRQSHLEDIQSDSDSTTVDTNNTPERKESVIKTRCRILDQESMYKSQTDPLKKFYLNIYRVISPEIIIDVLYNVYAVKNRNKNVIIPLSHHVT